MDTTGKTSDTIVGIGQIAFASTGWLVCYAVGSCIALGLVNEETGHAAMAHIFLPKASKSMSGDGHLGKYADTAVDEMLRHICFAESSQSVSAYLAGGARMFAAGFQSQDMDVGKLNSNEVLSQLESKGIPIRFEDIGGKTARNVRLDVGNRVMTVFTGGLG